MDDINNNNARPPQEQVDVTDNYDARKRRTLQLISVLQKKDNFFFTNKK